MSRETPDLRLRPMAEGDRTEVAGLIYGSTNHWYQTHGQPPIFSGGPQSADVFCRVYGAMEGSAGVVAVDGWSGRLAGSCFYHTRPTHVSLGIMNVHPNYFGSGVARRLLRWITDLADAAGKPVRLVSSALNLDSFSLYTRAGFVPRRTFQDIGITVPEGGLGIEHEAASRVRPAAADDVEGMGALEMELSGIRRDSDFRYFLDDRDGFWHVSVLSDKDGAVEGFLASSDNMLGPGVARTEAGAAALLLAELDRKRGGSVVFLVPVDCGELVQQVYSWGGRNCEIHVIQVRGDCQPLRGVTMPTFMPETG